MATANLYSRTGQQTGTQPLPDALFAQPVHRQALWESVKSYQANQRLGTHDTKTRSEVCYSGAKLYRQKGTGRARAGDARSPVRVGGGTVFGPHPRDHGYKLPKQVKRLALTSALSDRANHGRVIVVEDFSLEKPKTSELAKLLKALPLQDAHTLVVLPREANTLYMSLRNIRDVRVLRSNELNAYTVLWADNLVFTQTALGGAEEVFGS
jgi:large subunit ribosomal protein L4